MSDPTKKLKGERTSLILMPELIRKAKIYAVVMDLTMSELIEKALDEYVPKDIEYEFKDRVVKISVVERR